MNDIELDIKITEQAKRAYPDDMARKTVFCIGTDYAIKLLEAAKSSEQPETDRYNNRSEIGWDHTNQQPDEKTILELMARAEAKKHLGNEDNWHNDLDEIRPLYEAVLPYLSPKRESSDEIIGTMECPICGKNTPHIHTAGVSLKRALLALDIARNVLNPAIYETRRSDLFDLGRSLENDLQQISLIEGLPFTELKWWQILDKDGNPTDIEGGKP